MKVRPHGGVLACILLVIGLNSKQMQGTMTPRLALDRPPTLKISDAHALGYGAASRIHHVDAVYRAARITASLHSALLEKQAAC